MKAFVTGGTGFIGRHLVSQLVDKGYEVRALARSEEGAAFLESLGAVPVPGDITDVASMRPAMAGCDVVFHLAAWYGLGASHARYADAINVGGTRKVLRLAHELGVPKIVYTSTVAVFGDTQGQMVDESFYQGGPFLTEYDRTKWLAHYQVARPLIEKGAPIVIVMPGAVYGPEDTSAIGQLMRLFYRGLPVLVGPELTVTYAHVADVAAGHVLAAEKGKIGESYILAGPAVPLGEMVDFWARLTGKRSPKVRLPASVLRPFAPMMGFLENFVEMPPLFTEEAIKTLGASYTARSDKAREELGWVTRPLQTGMLETFEWIAETEAQRPTDRDKELKLAGTAVIMALSLFLLWFWAARRSPNQNKNQD
jgi:nucleoside-diphosphate-sugar epimerase